MQASAGRELTSVRAVGRSRLKPLVAQALVLALQITMVPAELFARTPNAATEWEKARREDARRQAAEDPAARPHPRSSRPLALAPVRHPEPARASHAWMAGRVALASLRSLLFRLIAPQTGGGPGPVQTTRTHTVPAGWSLLSVPLAPADPRADVVFDELPAPLRLYDTVNGQTVSPDEPGFRSVSPGRAFWALLDSPVAVSATGLIVSTSTAQAVALVPGWNAVSTPWLTAIPWTDGRVSVRRGSETVALTEAAIRGWIDAELHVHDNATDAISAVPPNAAPAAELRPWQGALVFAHVQADLVFSVPPPDTTPPVVSFTAPAESALVTVPTAITGTADDPNLLEWKLEISAGSGSPFGVIATSETPVVGGTLLELDPTTLENGLAVLRLSAVDVAGNGAAVERTVVIEGQNKLGNFRIAFKDLEVPVSGIPIAVTRVYDSRARFSSRDFGFGWTVEIEGRGRYANNRKPGDGWFFQSGPLGLPCIGAVTPTKSHVTEVRFSDLEVYRFSLRVTSPAPVLGGCFGTASFTQTGGIPGASLAILGNDEVFWPAGSGSVVELDTMEVYEPANVRLTTRGGRVFDLNLRNGLQRVADPNGNALQISASGVLHSSGRSVGFQRDGAGRITSITDPSGKALVYRYDAAGNLAGVKDRTNNEATFEYDAEHFLRRVVDPTGNVPARQEFDEDGRLIAVVDAAGNRTEVSSDPGANASTVTDRLGGETTQQYDAAGNLTGATLPGGVTNEATYDARGNMLTETDGLGRTTTRTYDANNNVLSVTDPLGHTTSHTYDSGNRVLTTTDPRGKVVTRTYDPRGNLLTLRDAAGSLTTYTYDTSGNKLTERDALGCESRYEYDTFGNLTRETDAAGGVITYTYDANGNRATETRTRTVNGAPEALVTTLGYDAEGRETQVTDADGSVSKTEYDGAGRRAATVDKLNRRTEFTYNELGQQVRTTYADGTFEEFTYDGEGRRETSRDRAGRVTTYQYDPLDRLLRTTYADGSSTSNTYDAAGRVLTATDERGRTVRSEYDAAGRRIKVTDATGQVSLYGYDAANNQTSFTDARGKVTTYEYDDVNRLLRTVHPDGTTDQVTYDAAGRKLTQTDQAGKVTRFAYDCLGQVTTVTDALGQITRYAYDEVGSRISQTDANGHVTRFEHDALGRLSRRTLPGGASESFLYDAAGNPATRTDFSGAVITYAHDADGRLTQRSHAGGTVAFTYTPAGKRATAADAAGTVQYGYDLRDRLTSLTYPDGRRLVYGYDARGNRTSLAATLASGTHTSTYTYDGANRMETVNDPQGRPYTYGYDPNGNRISLAQPNGVVTTYGYNDLNRLTTLQSSTAAGGVVQSYAFTLGPTGARTRIDEQDGTSRVYGYDDLYRLTRETVTGGGTPNHDTSYGYDPVGNRLTRQTTLAGAPPATAYAYDERDRMLSAGGTSYAWDANGNLTTRSGADGAAYVWDLDGRLRRVEKADGTVVEHAYDADGNRLQTRVTPPTGPPTVSNFLVDTAGELSHVVAETDATGGLLAYHVRGDDLLATIRGSGTRFFHADGVGSVRRLTDETGAVTDTYTFSAFGELLQHTGSDPNAYLFAGEPLDPNSGFYYNRARWLDAAAGRFVSMDPAAGDPYDPATLHKYLYAAADPLNKVDPSGLFFAMVMSFSINLFTRLGTMAMAAGGTALIFMMRMMVHAAAAMRSIQIAAITGYDRYVRLVQQAYGLYPRIRDVVQMHHVIPQYIVRHLANAGVRLPQWIANWTVPLPARYHQLITNAIRAEYPFGAANVFSKNGDGIARLFKVLIEVYWKYPLGPM